MIYKIVGSVFVGVALSAAVGVFLLLKALQTEMGVSSTYQAVAEQMEKAALDNHMAHVEEVKERQRQLELLDNLRDEMGRIDSSRREARERIRELEAANEEVRTWAGQPIPEPVIDELRNRTGTGSRNP